MCQPMGPKPWKENQAILCLVFLLVMSIISPQRQLYIGLKPCQFKNSTIYCYYFFSIPIYCALWLYFDL